jgi:hypothetical protein
LKALKQFAVFVPQTANDLFQFEDGVKNVAKFVLEVVIVRPLRGVSGFFQQANCAIHKPNGSRSQP